MTGYLARTYQSAILAYWLSFEFLANPPCARRAEKKTVYNDFILLLNAKAKICEDMILSWAKEDSW
jgi:hypothetical protein